MNTNKETKKSRAQSLINKNKHKFKCPVCGGSMTLNGSFNLVCGGSHTYDLSRKGYLNLLTAGNNAKYSKELFEARHEVCASGFYDQLIKALRDIIIEHRAADSKDRFISVLDAGCGEGSHLFGLSQVLGGTPACSLFGVDIAKEGIKIAAGHDADIIWAVADLSKLPFQKDSFSVILNILSPANYHEFERILEKDGILIKVIPGKSYLEEIRHLIFEENDYSNSRVIDYFSGKFELVTITSVLYQVQMDEVILPHLLKMTPLAWGLAAEKRDNLNISDIPYVTVDLKILIGTKPNEI